MSTQYAIPTVIPTHGIVIIDSKKLRQAGIMHLLRAWAETNGLTLSAVLSDGPIGEHLNANCEMVILSVGSASVEDPQQQKLIQSIRTRLPRAALVVLSDREEATEARAAFVAGAAGFMPTSIEPGVALQALSFIKGGGTFFPPSSLFQVEPRPNRGRATASGLDRTNGVSHDLRTYPSNLSAKQEQVFRLLRDGPSNKVIARRLGLSEATVKVHIRCIMRKLGVLNRTQLAIAAVNSGTQMLDESSNELESEALEARIMGV